MDSLVTGTVGSHSDGAGHRVRAPLIDQMSGDYDAKLPSGLYHGRGWTVEVGQDAEADEVLVASIHEAMQAASLLDRQQCLVRAEPGRTTSFCRTGPGRSPRPTGCR